MATACCGKYCLLLLPMPAVSAAIAAAAAVFLLCLADGQAVYVLDVLLQHGYKFDAPMAPGKHSEWQQLVLK